MNFTRKYSTTLGCMSIAQYFQTVVQSIIVYSVNYGIVHDLFLQLSLVVWGYVHLWSSVSHFSLLTVCQALFYFYCQQWASLCLPVKAGSPVPSDWLHSLRQVLVLCGICFVLQMVPGDGHFSLTLMRYVCQS